MESPTDRTETHAIVDSNTQAPSEVFSFPHCTLTIIMHLQADCKRRTTNSAATVTDALTSDKVVNTYSQYSLTGDVKFPRPQSQVVLVAMDTLQTW